jgi:hypothetical protein
MATAAQQRASSARGTARSDQPVDYWRRPGTPKTIARHRFRARILRPGLQTLTLTNAIEGVSWDDVSSVLTGTITMRLPTGSKVQIKEGHVVVLEWSPQGFDAYRELWRMRVKKPAIDLPTGAITCEVLDDLAFLQLSKDDFVYHTDKAHPHGWAVHQLVAAICKRYGVRVGSVPRSSLRIKRFSRLGVSPLDAIVYALRKLREHTGKKLVLRYERGRLIVEPLRRSRELLVMSRTIIGAAYSRTAYVEGFATVVTAKGTAKKGKGRRAKLRVRVESKAGRRQYGTVHQLVDSSGDTRAEVRTTAKRRLARVKDPSEELTITHSGIPTLKRGQAIRVEVDEVGVRQVVFVKEVRHQVTGRDYQMSVTLRFDDPFVDAAAKSSSAKRAAAAKTRGRNVADTSTKTPPRPARAATRADK